ncbi:MAG: hypothetical protein Q9192_009090, partial [Flavoplaca navasiana]
VAATDEDKDDENDRCEPRTLAPQPEFEVDQKVLDEILVNQPEEGGEEPPPEEPADEPPPEEPADEPPPEDVRKECKTWKDCPECPDGKSPICAGASTAPPGEDPPEPK